MSREETIIAINQILETLPDYAIRELLDFLKKIATNNQEATDTWSLFKRILAEDADLLKRLGS